jgi:predicted TIM-barrel fold metal-dependent hydrolase
MKLEFFDVNVWFGNLRDDKYRISVSLKQIEKKMDELNIKKVIVYHISQRDVYPEFGNEILIKEIGNKEKFYGIITLLPFQTDEIKKICFKELKKKKIVGFNFFPKRHNYILNKTTFGDFLFELENKNFPVFLDIYSCDYNDVYSILNDFPDLTCILCNLGIWNTDRFTWPLLEKYPNVYLESSLLSLQEGGIEETVKKYGSKRIVFGSGFPERYFEASILQITHSEIEKKDKENIAYKNIERIIGNIKYE